CSALRLQGWGCRSSVVGAIAAGRVAELPFERAVEGGLGLVADIGGDLGYASRGLLKRACGELKSPASEVGHGRLGEVASEAFGERGAGDSHFVCEVGDGPRMSDTAVKEAEASAYDGIAGSGEPSGLLFGKDGDVATERVDEECFRELGEHGFAADA